MRASAVSILLTVLAFAFAVPANAQGTAEDYERASKLAGRTRGKLLRSAVNPTWLSPTTLWYSIRTSADDFEAVVVDTEAEASERRRVVVTSAELREDLGLKKAPAIEGLRIDGDEMLLLLRGVMAGARRVGDGKLRPWNPIGSSLFHLPPSPRERSSGDGMGRTWILFVNYETDPVELHWIQPDGSRRSYGKVQPKGRRWMQTYVNHEWSITNEAGERIVGYRATTQSGLATTKPPKAAREKSERAENERRDRRRNGTSGARMRGRSSRSPNGRLELIVEGTEVLLRKRNSKAQEVLTTVSEGASFDVKAHWSADGSSVLCYEDVTFEPRIVHTIRALPKGKIQPELESYGYTKPGDQIGWKNLRLFVRGETGFKEVPIDQKQFENPWRLDMNGFEPEGDRFFVRYNQRGHRVLRMSTIDGKTGEIRTLVEEAPETFVDYAGKGFARWLTPAKELLWMSERSGFNHLYLVRADEKGFGEITPLTKGDWPVFKVESVDSEARTILFQAGGIDPAQDPYHVHWGRVAIDTGEITWLTEGDGTHDITFSPSGEHYFDRYSRVDRPPVVELRRTSDGSLVTELGRADDSVLRTTGWTPPQRFVAKGRDGKTDIHGWVIRPTNFDPSTRYPIIEHIYAGPHSAHVPKSFSVHRREAELAELGFVVVRIDGMGTSKRSKAFHDVAWKNLGDAGFPDRILWMKALAATDPAIDITRVGIYGGSAGGQNAMRALIAHNDFYDVAVADCGCHDNRVDKIWWNELWMSWPIGPHYEEASNVNQAHRMEGKLLLTVGAVDRNVDPASTLQVVEALIRADKDFDLLVFPNGGHGIGESPYGVRRRRDYFVRHLLGVEPRR